MNELQTQQTGEIAQTVENLRKYLSVPSDKKDDELALDLHLAKKRGLDPFAGEMYYAQDGKLALTKSGEAVLASRNEKFQPPTAGVVVITEAGELIQRVGTVKLPSDTLFGAWAKIDSLGYENTVSLVEYYNGSYVIDENGQRKLDVNNKPKKKKKGNGQDMGENVWDTKPATMIRKVAVVHALRECYPQSYSGIFDESEAGFLENKPEKQAPKQEQRQEPKQAEIIEEF